jgi:hypothetical protein
LKICIFGNSHTGAIKRGWDRLADTYPGTELVFFASRGQGLKTLASDGRYLYSEDPEVEASLKFTSGTEGRVNPSEYDAFLVYASGCQAFIPRHFYSEAVTESALNEKASKSMSSRIISLIRTLSDKPIWVGHTPLRPSHLNIDSSPIEDEIYASGIDAFNKTFYSRVSASLLPQPSETCAEHFLTKQRFAKGSKCLAIGDEKDNSEHGDADKTHMNDEFGELWLASFLQRVRSEISN